jgi:hypothetical protein
MGFLARLFGGSPSRAGDSRSHSQLATGGSKGGVATQNATRRELLRIALGETLQRHGIPASWITAEVLSAISRAGATGIHWRLLVRHWDPQLMIHTVALQNRLMGRVQMLDPHAESWLMGISWQFALRDESACPDLPHPGSWTAEPRPARGPSRLPVPEGGSAGVIAGPVRVHTGMASDIRADLEQLMAIRDADMRARQIDRAEGAGHEATQPMYMKTEPDKL